ncbi:RagB/SusD family nutrient uptake outer membrane protein [Pontibacter diazotrophicus]|uniref:RagB/SusD family nutrient uptake outer membrane protein n=1 Tax=Pontibacter diazotrophicus TaxID=1400979 RepID=A0A3D8LD28_9BACT|nr:RagB/SusD family nutrient uptake outer membrane protein [Pontibacter diazotrophicus]RDV15318.1 RagB/SusD family nutrient uptake outer membrane protein [Pontibacter diazotrophicus]
MKKKYIKPLLVSLAMGGLLTFSSCESYLDVENPSTVSQEAVFNSVGYTSSAITGIYNKLMGDNGYGSRVSTLYPNAGDDFIVGGAYNPLDRRGISGFGVHPDNSEIYRPFLEMYAGIERANIAIKYIPLSPLYENGTEAEQAAMRKMYGEALTLRAIFYHELIRNWGDVPAQFEPSADIPDLYLPKTDRDEIYDRLLVDLQIASDLVPWRSESGDPSTRITKSAVKGLRARIALARGGYSLRRESGVMERRSDYRDHYQIARNETLDIIQSGQHSLNPEFEQVFRSLHTAGGDPTNEHIFQVGAFGGNSRTDSKLGYSNGIRIDRNSVYGAANGQLEAIPTYFYEFDSLGDSRRDVTLAYFTINKDDNKELVSANVMRDGKFRKYWTSIAGTNQNLGINWPILRYADVLLMFAEADNELNGAPSAEAVAAYEAVRSRAYTGYEERMGTTPTGQTEFLEAVRQERFLEFGGEGIRKYDLIRWNLLEQTINETRAKLTDFMNGEGRYANVPQYVYTIPTRFNNAPDVSAEMATFDLFGGSVAGAMYTPAPASTPAGYTRKNWRAAVNADYVAQYAVAFEPNKSELFPIYSGVLNQNYNLTQDYGY